MLRYIYNDFNSEPTLLYSYSVAPLFHSLLPQTSDDVVGHFYIIIRRLQLLS